MSHTEKNINMLCVLLRRLASLSQQEFGFAHKSDVSERLWTGVMMLWMLWLMCRDPQGGGEGFCWGVQCAPVFCGMKGGG